MTTINKIEFVAQGHVDSSRTMYCRGNATVQGVTHEFSCHLYLWTDRVWRIGEEGNDDYKRRSSLYTNDRWISRKHIPASDFFRKKVWTLIEEEAGLWALGRDGEFVQGEALAYDTAIESVTQDLAKLQKQVIEMQQKLLYLKTGEETVVECGVLVGRPAA